MRVAGYFKGVMGTGEHGRQLVAALRSQGVEITLATLHPDASPEDDDLAVRTDGTSDRAFSQLNLLCVNADMVPQVAGQLGPQFFADRYTIGFWAWEVSSFPSRFAAAFEYVDEVWVGSRHVQEAVAQVVDRPVLRMPQPVSMVPAADTATPPKGLPEGFRFLFAFDYLSVFERKNPLGTIEAFSRAFRPGVGATLIVKALNPEYDQASHERLKAAVAEHPDVHLIDRRLTRSERDGLTSAIDCYVSLHRAEGFGYTLAEAMWLGKPAIATGYSGNVDFMTHENSYLVDYRLVPIGPGHDPYPPDGQWAQPHVDHAARLMREVFDGREAARTRGERAARDIRRTHGLATAGRCMLERLEVLERSGPVRRSASSIPEPNDHLRALINAAPSAPGRPRFGAAQRLARRALLRVLKPMTTHQRRIDQGLLNELEALRARVQRLEAGPESEMTSQRSGRS
jgi:glycosyltransferase involved in cell wall biosynthesis